MLIVILLIGIILLFVGLRLMENYDLIGEVITFLGGVSALISIIALIPLAIIVSNLSTIDERIEMYQTENVTIEQQIANVVSEYQSYETEIITTITPDEAMTLVSLYPELKSDTLVKSQIDIYISNNNEIKELRNEKISGRVFKWWVCFGN